MNTIISEAEQLYRNIFETITDGLIISDLKTGRVLEANPAACAMHGYARTQFLGLYPATYIHSKSQKVFTKSLQTIRSGSLVDTFVLHVRQDGSTFTAEWRGMTISFHNRKCLLSVVRDVSQRIQAERRLHKRIETHAREQSVLLEIAQSLASTQEHQPGLILDQLRGYIRYSNAGLFKLTGSTLTALAMRISPGSSARQVGPGSSKVPNVLVGMKPDDPGYSTGGWLSQGEHTAPLQVHLEGPKTLATLYNEHRPIRIANVHSSNSSGRFFRALLKGDAAILLEGMGAWMWVPMAVNGQMVGGLVLAHVQRKYFTARHASLALSIADQVAASLVNAELSDHNRELAVQQERQRLAQNLHDAVNQSLFSAGLIAEVLPRLWESDNQDARQSLEDLRRLMRGALAEMRAILAELRPSVLTDSSLGDLLRQLANAFTGRTNVPVSLNITGEHVLPSNIQVVLYRICQEALNNIAKHADASQVKIDLRYEIETEKAVTSSANTGMDQEIAVKSVELHIRDDGRGFNPRKRSAPGHYGLGMMHERAEAAGAQLMFTSRRGHGTLITLRWQKKSTQENP